MNQPIVRASAGLALIAATTLGLSACGSSPAKSSAPPSSSSPSASPTAAGSSAAAVTAAVTKAYTTFFDGTKHPAQSEAALQNGSKLTAVMAEAAKSPTAADISAKVSKVVLINPHLAKVTFSLFSKGFAVLTNTSGEAVLTGSTWQVAAATFCGLTAAEAGGTIPAGCTASVMAVPTQ